MCFISVSVVVESVESLVTVLQVCSGAAVMDRQSHAVFVLLPSCQTFCDNQSMLASWYFVALSLPPYFPPSVSLHSHSSPEFQTAVLSLCPPPSVIFFLSGLNHLHFWKDEFDIQSTSNCVGSIICVNAGYVPEMISFVFIYSLRFKSVTTQKISTAN